jgi:hypothetical protein
MKLVPARPQKKRGDDYYIVLNGLGIHVIRAAVTSGLFLSYLIASRSEAEQNQ